MELQIPIRKPKIFFNFFQHMAAADPEFFLQLYASLLFSHEPETQAKLNKENGEGGGEKEIEDKERKEGKGNTKMEKKEITSSLLFSFLTIYFFNFILIF